jgi:hypothetical protein
LKLAKEKEPYRLQDTTHRGCSHLLASHRPSRAKQCLNITLRNVTTRSALLGSAQELLEGMTGVQRMSIRLLESIQEVHLPPILPLPRKPDHSSEIRKILPAADWAAQDLDHQELLGRLRRACAGELRKKSPAQISRIKRHRFDLCVWAVLIAILTNTIAGVFETWMMYEWGTDSFGFTNAGNYLNCNNCTNSWDSPMGYVTGFGMDTCEIPYLNKSCDITGAYEKGSADESILEDLEEFEYEEENGVDVTKADKEFKKLLDKKRHYICACTGGMSSDGVSWKMLGFWVLNGPMIAVTVVAEIFMMGFMALRAR